MSPNEHNRQTKSSHAAESRNQSGDDQRQHQRDAGELDVCSGEAQEEETPDGDSGSDAKEAGDSDQGRVPSKDKKVTWIARSPTFYGRYHYSFGINFPGK